MGATQRVDAHRKLRLHARATFRVFVDTLCRLDRCERELQRENTPERRDVLLRRHSSLYELHNHLDAELTRLDLKLIETGGAGVWVDNDTLAQSVKRAVVQSALPASSKTAGPSSASDNLTLF